jgi:hypothetical protein
MNKLFDLQYLFDVTPGDANLLFWRALFLVAGLIIALSITATIFTKQTKKDNLRYRLWFRMATWGYTTSGIILLLGFFRMQNAYMLSMRALIFSWLIGSGIWLLFILKYWILDLPRKLREREEHIAHRQYFPSKK